MSKPYILVAGGSPALWPAQILDTDAQFVGVDRGSMYLLDRGIVPTLAVGDFDSITPADLLQIEQQVADIHYSIPEKDDTDTELALADIFQREPQAQVTLIGVTGGRLDHFLSNLWLPLDTRFEKYLPQIQVADAQNTIRYFAPGNYVITKEPDKKYVAFVCLSPVAELTIVDAKYRLTKENVSRPYAYASNEFVSETIHFSFAAGRLAVIQSRD